MRDILMLAGRILMSAMFLQAGFSELMHFEGTVGYFQSLGMPFPSLMIWPVLAVEIVGGLAILLGFFTRPAAALLALFSVAAGSIGHADIGDIMHFQALMKDIAVGGGFLYIAVHDAGRLSLDARLGA